MQDKALTELHHHFKDMIQLLWQKIDDDIPEFTNNLLMQLYPYALLPKPSFTIFELKANKYSNESFLNLPAKHSFKHQQHDFVTCFATTVLPLKITDIKLKANAIYQELTLSLSSFTNTDLSCLNLTPIRVYLHETPFIQYLLYANLLTKLEKTYLVTETQTKQIRLNIEPVGFIEQQKLMPLSQTIPNMIDLLDEFFAFPAKFMFLDIYGLPNLEPSKAFKLKFCFNTDLILNKLNTDCLKLNCTPVLNLSEVAAKPFSLDGSKEKYILATDTIIKNQYDILQIKNINSWLTEQQANKTYRQGDFLHHRATLKNHHYLSFPYKDDCETEIISANLYAYETQLFEDLNYQEINNTNLANEPLYYQAITPLSTPTKPNLHKNLLLWLSCNLSHKLQLFNNINSIRSCLDIFAKTYPQNYHKLHKNLQFTNTCNATKLIHNQVVYGLVTNISFKQQAFLNTGEKLLFTQILKLIFTENAAINSFHDVNILINPQHDR